MSVSRPRPTLSSSAGYPRLDSRLLPGKAWPLCGAPREGHVAANNQAETGVGAGSKTATAANSPLWVLSMRLWDERRAISIGTSDFDAADLIYATHDEAALAGWEKWREVAKEITLTPGRRAGRRWPSASPKRAANGSAGHYWKRDGKAEPAPAAPAIAEGARTLGRD